MNAFTFLLLISVVLFLSDCHNNLRTYGVNRPSSSSNRFEQTVKSPLFFENIWPYLGLREKQPNKEHTIQYSNSEYPTALYIELLSADWILQEERTTPVPTDRPKSPISLEGSSYYNFPPPPQPPRTIDFGSGRSAGVSTLRRLNPANGTLSLQASKEDENVSELFRNHDHYYLKKIHGEKKSLSGSSSAGINSALHLVNGRREGFYQRVRYRDSGLRRVTTTTTTQKPALFRTTTRTSSSLVITRERKNSSLVNNLEAVGRNWTARTPKNYEIQADNVPKCAQGLNVTFCVNDPDYPRQDIVDSIQQFGSPVSSLLYKDSSGVSQLLDVVKEKDYNCDSFVHFAKPLRARNIQGDWKVLIQIGETSLPNRNVMAAIPPTGGEQIVRLGICTSEPAEVCSKLESDIFSHCFQKEVKLKMLAWTFQKGLHQDIFRFPVDCQCYVGGEIKSPH